MAKKRAAKMKTASPKVERAAKPVRLDLSLEDHDRLEVCARRVGLNKSSYARMAVLEKIAECEAKERSKG